MPIEEKVFSYSCSVKIILSKVNQKESISKTYKQKMIAKA